MAFRGYFRAFSSAGTGSVSSPAQGSPFKVALLKWGLLTVAGVSTVGALAGAYSCGKIEHMLSLQRYLTEGEVEACRSAAQKLIKERHGYFTPKGALMLGPAMTMPLLPVATEREAASHSELRNRNCEVGEREAREIAKNALWGTKEEALRAKAKYFLFPVYTQEQIEFIVRSPEALRQLREGVLMDAAQLEQLRQKEQLRRV